MRPETVAAWMADHYAVEDGPGGAGLYPVSEWSKGEVIKDSKTVDLVDPREVERIQAVAHGLRPRGPRVSRPPDSLATGLRLLDRRSQLLRAS